MASRIFLYHAQGVALGGILTDPPEIIEANAMASMPITGGRGYSRVNGFRSKTNVISFDAAETEVTGSFKQAENAYETIVTTTVRGLNIENGMLSASAVTAKLTSKHPINADEPSISVTGSKIEGLKIAGAPIAVDLDTQLFEDLGTYKQFKDKFEHDPGFQTDARRRFLWGKLDDTIPQFLRERYSWCQQQPGLPESKGIVPCSLVRNITNNTPEIKRYAHVLVVPNFGKVFIGELLMKNGTRRLTMMRMELGSPVDGTVTVSSGEGNSSLYP